MHEPLRSIGLVFSREFCRLARSKTWLLITLGVPVILVIAYVIVSAVREPTPSQQSAVLPTGLVIESVDVPAVDGQAIPGFLGIDSRERAVDAINAGTIDQAFVVAKDYLTTGRVEWLHRSDGMFGGMSQRPDDFRVGMLTAYLRAALAGDHLAPERLARSISGVSYVEYGVSADGTEVQSSLYGELGSFVLMAAFAVVLMATIMLGSGSLLTSVSEEKENRMGEVLLTSVSPLALMTGKVLGIGAAGLLTMGVHVASAIILLPRIFDVASSGLTIEVDPGAVAWLIAFFLAGYFLSAVVVVVLGSLSSGLKEANQLSVIVILPLLIALYSSPAIVATPDGVAARVLTFIPLTAPVAMMVRMAVGGSSALESLASLIVIVGLGILVLLVAARVYSGGLLAYGRGFSLRDVARAFGERR